MQPFVDDRSIGVQKGVWVSRDVVHWCLLDVTKSFEGVLQLPRCGIHVRRHRCLPAAAFEHCGAGSSASRGPCVFVFAGLPPYTCTLADSFEVLANIAKGDKLCTTPSRRKSPLSESRRKSTPKRGQGTTRRKSPKGEQGTTRWSPPRDVGFAKRRRLQK